MTTTTADWNIGSSACYFTSGELAQTDYVALGSRWITSATMNATGSNVGSLAYFLSADGTTFESANLGQLHTFTVSGSGLKWKAEEQSVLTSGLQMAGGEHISNNNLWNISGAAGTVEMWIKPDYTFPAGSYIVFVDNGNAGPTWGNFSFRRMSTGSMNVTMTDTTPTRVLITGQGSPINTEWHHVSTSWDGTKAYLHLDGKFMGSGAFGTVTATQCASPVLIGSSYERVNNYEGVVDEFRYSNICRYSGNSFNLNTPSITQYSTDANTIALYHCEDNTNNITSDSSGHNYHGSLIGTIGVVDGHVVSGGGGNPDANGIIARLDKIEVKY